MTVATVQRLGNLLVERGFLRLEDLQASLAHQQVAGKTKLLGEIIVELGFCTEEQ